MVLMTVVSMAGPNSLGPEVGVGLTIAPSTARTGTGLSPRQGPSLAQRAWAPLWRAAQRPGQGRPACGRLPPRFSLCLPCCLGRWQRRAGRGPLLGPPLPSSSTCSKGTLPLLPQSLPPASALPARGSPGHSWGHPGGGCRLPTNPALSGPLQVAGSLGNGRVEEPGGEQPSPRAWWPLWRPGQLRCQRAGEPSSPRYLQCWTTMQLWPPPPQTASPPAARGARWRAALGSLLCPGCAWGFRRLRKGIRRCAALLRRRRRAPRSRQAWSSCFGQAQSSAPAQRHQQQAPHLSPLSPWCHWK